jgi:hypothetical protein
MSEPTSGWRSRLTEPSSAAGLAALLALIVPSLADHAPAIVELSLTCGCRGRRHRRDHPA